MPAHPNSGDATACPRRGDAIRLWVLLGPVLMLMAATCGNEPRASSGDTSAIQAGIDGCAKIDDVELQLQWFAQAQFGGYYAALENGYYAKRCLNVVIVEGAVDIVPQQQLASGAVDYAISWVPKALASREGGDDIVNVAQIFQRSATRQISFADSGIASPSDLAGKRVGTSGFGNDFELLAGSRIAGVEPGEDFTLIQQGFDMSGLISGDLDSALGMTYNELAQVLETTNPATGRLYTLEDLTVIDWNEFGSAMLQDGIWADGARLDDDSYDDQTVRFIASSIEGWIWCRDHAEECVDIVLANGSTLGRSHQTWQLNEVNKLIWPSIAGVGRMDETLWKRTVDIAISEGLLGQAPDKDSYSTKYVEAALGLLSDVEATGSDWTAVEVVLREGGE